jgi:hypothetical protein
MKRFFYVYIVIPILTFWWMAELPPFHTIKGYRKGGYRVVDLNMEYHMRNKGGNKITASKAGYMELTNARKDSDCSKVNVPGGVSLALGCCNFFEPEGTYVQTFRCGTCEYKYLGDGCKR